MRGGFSKRSSNGSTTPTWLMNPGPLWMRRPNCHSKYEPNVEEFFLLDGIPDYSFLRLSNGKEKSVSSRHLAPIGSSFKDSQRITPTENQFPIEIITSTSPHGLSEDFQDKQT